MHKTMVVELSEIEFPSEDFSEEEETVTRRCTSFGEAAIMIANDPKALGITDFFKCFYNGFPDASRVMRGVRAVESGLLASYLQCSI